MIVPVYHSSHIIGKFLPHIDDAKLLSHKIMIIHSLHTFLFYGMGTFEVKLNITACYMLCSVQSLLN